MQGLLQCVGEKQDRVIYQGFNLGFPLIYFVFFRLFSSFSNVRSVLSHFAVMQGLTLFSLCPSLRRGLG